MSSPDEERQFRTVVWITKDDDRRAVFVIDGRDYPDSETVRAARLEALRALQRRRIPAEFETSQVGPQEPPLRLPSWPEYRDQLRAEEEG